MLFNTTQFFLFLAVVLSRSTRPRSWRYILLAASYFFYASWNSKFIALLLTLTAIDYTAGHLAGDALRPAPAKALLILSLSANLGFLGFFKYYNFLAGNLALLLGRPPHSFLLDIVLPLGISFHTFQSMSYVVDVYRGQQKAVRNPIDYALFICFFPQLVAGPIVRAHEFFRRSVPLAARPRRTMFRAAFSWWLLGPDQEDGVRRPVRQGRQPLFRERRRATRAW